MDADTAPPADSSSDERLVAQIASGQEEALDALYSRYSGVLFGIARRSLDPGAAEEIVQDVFVTLWRHARAYDPTRGPLRPWLLQIAHYRVGNELRRRRRRPRTDAGSDVDPLANLRDLEPDPDDRLTLETRRARLRAALAELPEGERRAIGMSFFEELSHPEIAAALGVPLGTVKSRIRLGVGRLRQRLAAVSIAILIVSGTALLLLRARIERSFERDERALSMLTSSDSETIRIPAAPGVSSAVHGTWRARPAGQVVVVTLSNFAILPPGKVYRVWIFRSGRWSAIGTAAPDASGHGRLIAEGEIFATRPDAIEIRVEERQPAAFPSGSVMALWRNTSH